MEQLRRVQITSCKGVSSAAALEIVRNSPKLEEFVVNDCAGGKASGKWGFTLADFAELLQTFEERPVKLLECSVDPSDWNSFQLPRLFTLDDLQEVKLDQISRTKHAWPNSANGTAKLLSMLLPHSRFPRSKPLAKLDISDMIVDMACLDLIAQSETGVSFLGIPVGDRGIRADQIGEVLRIKRLKKCLIRLEEPDEMVSKGAKELSGCGRVEVEVVD